jgi:hypothetical protein
MLHLKHIRVALLLLVSTLFLPACDIFRERAVESPDIAVNSMKSMYSLIQAEKVPPPRAARIYAYTGIALYEGLVNGRSDFQTLADQLNGLSTLPKPSSTSLNWQVVASKASSYVATELLKQDHTLAQSTLDALKALESGTDASSVQYGETLGKALVEWANQDGFLTTRGKAYTPPVGNGLWVPTPPANAAPLEPYWGTLRPFTVNTDYSDCKSDQPYPYSIDPNSTFLRDAKEVYDVSKALTDGQKAIANFWADDAGATGTPPGHWIAITRQMIEDKQIDLMHAAELYALVGISLNDAFMTGWYTKFKYNVERPITCIRKAIDPNWTPLLTTPPFPEYPSGHSIGSGAASAVLTTKLGTVAFTDKTKSFLSVPDRSFASFRDAANEAAISRLYGGIHYVNGNNGGLKQGNCVGEAVTINLRTEKK